MKNNPPPNSGSPSPARLNPLLLAAVAFALGIALTGAWIHHQHSGDQTDGLSASTRALLGDLGAPVTIRYFSVLPAGSASEALQAYAGRVAQLLKDVQAAGHGKIQIIRLNSSAETNAVAAESAGLQAFNLDLGDACFLGMTIASGQHQEAFARLQPEWENALEFDLARAILRAAMPDGPDRLAPEIVKPTPETIATIQRLVPDVNAVSTEQADEIFHAEFLKQCGEAGAALEIQVNAAQQQVVDAQNNGSLKDLAATQKNLLQVELAQGGKFKELAAQLEIQLAVFQRMKNAGTNSGK